MKVLSTKKCLNCDGTVYIREKQYASHQRVEDNKKFCKPTCARTYGLKRSWAENREYRVSRIKEAMQREDVKEKKAAYARASTGSNSHNWYGDKATYNSIHRWIQKHWKKTGKCEFCMAKPPVRVNGASGTEWANISDTYDRDDREDWLELCSSCHHIFDRAKKILQ